VGEADVPRVRVLLADDHRIFAEALGAMLSTHPRIEIVGYAGNGQEAIDLVESLRPDLVVMDKSMPLMGGIEATERILERHPRLPVLLLTGSDPDELPVVAHRIGAAGFLTKRATVAELTEAVLRAAEGRAH
jgi:DNA-binding NarL/FixJ family response regulator